MTQEYKVGSYRALVSRGKCNSCHQTKPVRREPSLGRWVHLCKPCRKELGTD